MIIDINAWFGCWGTSPCCQEISQVRDSLMQIGVEQIHLSSLQAAWSHNPHLLNKQLYKASRDYPEICPVPILDPTIPSWREELTHASHTPHTCWVKLLPPYSRYSLEQANELFISLTQASLGVIVQVRIEDPRHQHPLAQVADFPAKEIVKAAARHPGLPFIIGGAGYTVLTELKQAFSDLPNLYADTSQIDGLEGLKMLVEQGLGDRLIFGSHAPLFIPLAGLARVVNDLDEASALLILSGNVRRIMQTQENQMNQASSTSDQINNK
jgi:uncharacterized protein